MNKQKKPSVDRFGDGPIRWGIIGAGDVCEVKSGPALYKAPGSALTAITKRNAPAAEDFAGRHNVSRWYTDPDRLIADPEVDAVYVATPPHLHRTFAEAVMKAGKPVLVEKPMATTAADCDAMIESSLVFGVSLWVAYYRRALQKFVDIRRAVLAGEIGRPNSVVVEFSQDRARYVSKDGNGPWRVDPATAGAGIIADMGSHMLDLVDWILGPVTSVKAVAVNRAGDYVAEDVVAATFTTAGGSVGSALWDFSGRLELDRTVIRGSEGTVEYSTFDDTPAKITTTGANRTMVHQPFPTHVHQPLIELINAELRGGAPSPSTAVSAARTNRVLDALVAGYYGNRP